MKLIFWISKIKSLVILYTRKKSSILNIYDRIKGSRKTSLWPEVVRSLCESWSLQTWAGVYKGELGFIRQMLPNVGPLSWFFFCWWNGVSWHNVSSGRKDLFWLENLEEIQPPWCGSQPLSQEAERIQEMGQAVNCEAPFKGWKSSSEASPSKTS